MLAGQLFHSLWKIRVQQLPGSDIQRELHAGLPQWGAGKSFLENHLRHSADEPCMLYGRDEYIGRNLFSAATPARQHLKTGQLSSAYLDHGLEDRVKLFVVQSTLQISAVARHGTQFTPGCALFIDP